MVDAPMTRASLLVRIRDHRDDVAWGEFVELYAPLVYGLARRRGLQDADASDLTQEVLRDVARRAPQLEYDPGRGTFRGWLFTVTRNRLRKWTHAQRRQEVTGDEATRRSLEEIAAPEEEWWEQEYHRHLLTRAAERVRPAVRPATWEAFWQTAIEERDPQEVGAALGMSVGAVYIARCRVLARLREQLDRLRME